METIEGGYGYTIIERDETVCEREVRKVYKNAYVRRTIYGGYYSYQVGIRKNLFWFEPIGDSHMFLSQVWASAYAMLQSKGILK